MSNENSKLLSMNDISTRMESAMFCTTPIETPQPHLDQKESEDVGRDEHGSPVNLDLWEYIDEENWYVKVFKYRGEIIDGEIQGFVPASVNGKEVRALEYTFDGCTALVTAPAIPKYITRVIGVFRGCKSLVTAPVIPKNITEMEYMFFGCTSLVEAPTIPEGVTRVYTTFKDCVSLVIAPAIPEGVTDMRAIFAGCTALVKAPIIPEGVQYIGYAFLGCTSLIEAPVIPDSVTDIDSTFSGCTSLVTAPVIPEGIRSLYYTFKDCVSLINAPVIPKSVTDMSATFEGCISLIATSCTMPIETSQHHPDQKLSKDVGFDEQGNLVNLDLWEYSKESAERHSAEEDHLILIDRYRGDIVDGKTQGTVPSKINGIAIVLMPGVFEGNTALVTIPCSTSAETLQYHLGQEEAIRLLVDDWALQSG